MYPLNAVLAFENGTYFVGCGIGYKGIAYGTICFNTAMTGYEEIITDPSYKGQIITFTFPHIGNTGITYVDQESLNVQTHGIVLRTVPSEPSNYRSKIDLNSWLIKHKVVGIANIDTRSITKLIRKANAPIKSCIFYGEQNITKDLITDLVKQASSQPSLVGSHYALEVPTEANTATEHNTHKINPLKKVVLIDYGTKHNIIRELQIRGCEVKVVSSKCTYEEIIKENPCGIILSNGPGDPNAVYDEIKNILSKLIQSNIPIFGICFGFQLLSIAFGARVVKMPVGHHGANHPVKNIDTGKIEITSQNHEFMVDLNSLPPIIIPTHVSLFDETLSGMRISNKSIFSVQFHPEASPGPNDTKYLFDQFLKDIHKYATS